MNSKTPLVLLGILVVLGLGLALMQRSAPQAAIQTDEDESNPLEKSLVADDFGDVTEVVLQRKGGPEWKFKKVKKEGADEKDASWEIVSPIQAPAAKYVLDGIVRRVTGLKTQLTYKKGDKGAMTAAEADLDPPRETAILTNASGKSVKIGIGKLASDSSTYARLNDGDDVLVVGASLKDLLKKKDNEYRDLALVSFDKSRATRVEVDKKSDDGQDVRYVLVKSGSDWKFEEPFQAPANSKKITDLVNALSNLRVSNWIDDNSANLSVFGLKPPQVTVSVTVEEPAEEAEADDEGSAAPTTHPAESETQAEPKTEPKRTVHTVHLSNQSPIGEETKVYLQKAGETAVATVMKSTADKLIPQESDWRELKLMTQPVNSAEKLSITREGETVSLERTGDDWYFIGSTDAAESAEVKAVLNKLSTLEALGFVNESEGGKYGFDKPRALIEVTLPNRPESEKLEIGDYTDAQSKRLVYARRPGLPGVAKIRVDDVHLLLPDASAFRNRAIFEIDPQRIEEIAIRGTDAVTREPFATTLSRRDDQWVMTAPAELPTDTTKAADLADTLGKLNAVEVLAENGSADLHGLDNPTVTVTLRYRPVVDGTESASDDATVTLAFSEAEDAVYAKRNDRETLYRVDRLVFDKFRAEYRTLDLFNFDEKTVAALAIETPDGVSGFEKRDNKWVYTNEPLLPIDTKKVESLAAQIKAMKADRYVAHNADWSAYGLDPASRAMAMTVTLKEGGKAGIVVAAQGHENDPGKRLYAALADSKDVFMLPADTLDRFRIKITEYEPSAKSSEPKPAAKPMPPLPTPGKP